jgi:ABC-type phosphate transport system substrate-binding protein
LLSATCYLLLTICIICILTACDSQPPVVTREPAALRLVAADDCGPLTKTFAAAYEEAHPWVTVEVDIFNTAMAEQVLRAGEADMGLLSWLQNKPGADPIWSQPFTRDGIAVIAHPDTPFSETGLIHLQEIYRGHVQEWNGRILTIVSRENGAGARTAFEQVVLGDHYVAQTAVVMPSNEAVIAYVTHTPGALGYVSTLHLTETAAEHVMILPVEGVLPTPETISEGLYPLSRWLYLASVDEPSGEAREFAQWVLGVQGQTAISQLYE